METMLPEMPIQVFAEILFPRFVTFPYPPMRSFDVSMFGCRKKKKLQKKNSKKKKENKEIRTVGNGTCGHRHCRSPATRHPPSGFTFFSTTFSL